MMMNRHIWRRALTLLLAACMILPAFTAYAAASAVERVGEAMAQAAGTTGKRSTSWSDRYDFVTSAGHECYFSCSQTSDSQYLKGGSMRDMSFRTHPSVGAEITVYYFPMVKELLRQIVRPEEVAQAIAWLDAQEDAIYSAWQNKQDYNAPDPGLASMEFIYKYDKDYNELYMGVICKASTPMVVVNGAPYVVSAAAATATPSPTATPRPTATPAPVPAAANIREKIAMAMAAEVGVTGTASEYRYTFNTSGDDCYLTATLTDDRWAVKPQTGVSMSFRTHPGSEAEITDYYFPLLRALLHEVAPAKDVPALDAWLDQVQPYIVSAYRTGDDFNVTPPAVSSLSFKFKYDVDFNELYMGIGFRESTPVCTVDGVPYTASAATSAADVTALLSSVFSVSTSGGSGDFRGYAWGAAQADVQAKEGAPDFSGTVDGMDAGYIAYETTAVGLDVVAAYYFGQDGLFMTRYIFAEEHVEAAEYIADYEAFRAQLTKKYGTPAQDEIIWHNTLMQGAWTTRSDLGGGLAAGDISYKTVYNTPRATITMTMELADGRIVTTVEYESLTVPAPVASYYGEI